MRYLCFSLGAEEFGLPLLAVREVLAMPELTPVPHTPSYFLGVMNLRGRVVSVMDLRVKLGLAAARENRDAVVIICQLGEFTVGVTVDSVNSVIAPESTEFSDASSIVASRQQDQFLGVYRRKERLVLLLNVARVLGLDSSRAAAEAQAA